MYRQLVSFDACANMLSLSHRLAGWVTVGTWALWKWTGDAQVKDSLMMEKNSLLKV